MDKFDTVIGLMFIGWLIVSSLIIYKNEKKTKGKLLELKQQLYDLELCKTRTMYEEYHETPEVQIIQLEQRAKRLGFCYQCPLYRDKIQKDK